MIAPALALALVAAAAGPANTVPPAETSCLGCHSNAALFGPDRLQIVASHRRSVHGDVGLSCHDCHGGNPDPALASDAAAAMDPGFEANPYIGSPDRRTVPAFCGHCHSDPVYMRRFDPGARVDQEEEYWTSHHGQALRRGDADVATCRDCHGAHDVRRVDDVGAPVFPTRIAETCAACHADPRRMQGHTLPDGRPLPLDQYALWKQSIHASALLEKGDLSAPSCNDCHGNHGAAPPEVESVAQVCGRCHEREGRLFRASPKNEALALHREFLASAGDEGCAACHVPPEPQAALGPHVSLAQCTTCHSNHAVLRPSVALLAPLPETPCAFCHEAPGGGREIWGEPGVARSYPAVRDGLLRQAADQGLTGDERFDWLVEQARSLPFHQRGAATPGGGPALRPEFERLFDKFRIGSTHFRYRDPVSGEPRTARVTSCNTCHAAAPVLTDAPRGLETSAELLRRMRELTAVTAEAERVLLRARRGGVATQAALREIDRAVDAQVGLEVLVHGFSVAPESEFVRRHAQGLEHARGALDKARRALEELRFRRRGLIAFVFVVALVLVSLALKIRRISSRERASEG
jgi:hypothetical protein